MSATTKPANTAKPASTTSLANSGDGDGRKPSRRNWTRWLRNKRAPIQTPDPLAALQAQLPDATPEELATLMATRQTTMTSPERLVSLIRAVEYVIQQQIPGDLVECGVWRGGSMYSIARTLLRCQASHRRLWLYDTFEGMSPPTSADVDFRGAAANQLLETSDLHDPQGVWCYSALPEVQRHLASSGYPESQINYVVGKVEDTLPNRAPDQIALLRLDTDWYESTRLELEILFPRLSPGGILIIDDYGHWQGCRQAVDEYFGQHGIRMFLQRIDYTGRIGVKS